MYVNASTITDEEKEFLPTLVCVRAAAHILGTGIKVEVTRNPLKVLKGVFAPNSKQMLTLKGAVFTSRGCIHFETVIEEPLFTSPLQATINQLIGSIKASIISDFLSDAPNPLKASEILYADAVIEQIFGEARQDPAVNAATKEAKEAFNAIFGVIGGEPDAHASKD